MILKDPAIALTRPSCYLIDTLPVTTPIDSYQQHTTPPSIELEPATITPSSPIIQQPSPSVPVESIPTIGKMVTRSQHGIFKKKILFLAERIKEPTTVKQVVKDPN